MKDITIQQLMTEAENATVMLNVPGSGATAHAVGVTYDATSKLFRVHDPLLGVIYEQTAEDLGARILGDCVIGIK